MKIYFRIFFSSLLCCCFLPIELYHHLLCVYMVSIEKTKELSARWKRKCIYRLTFRITNRIKRNLRLPLFIHIYALNEIVIVAFKATQRKKMNSHHIKVFSTLSIILSFICSSYLILTGILSHSASFKASSKYNEYERGIKTYFVWKQVNMNIPEFV